MNRSPSAGKFWKNYVGVYSSPGSSSKVAITRDAATLHERKSGKSAIPREATAADKCKFERDGIVLEFDAAKNQMTLEQGEREIVFIREKQ